MKLHNEPVLPTHSPDFGDLSLSTKSERTVIRKRGRGRPRKYPPGFKPSYPRSKSRVKQNEFKECASTTDELSVINTSTNSNKNADRIEMLMDIGINEAAASMLDSSDNTGHKVHRFINDEIDEIYSGGVNEGVHSLNCTRKTPKKRAFHLASEQKRRALMKDMFDMLERKVPSQMFVNALTKYCEQESEVHALMTAESMSDEQNNSAKKRRRPSFMMMDQQGHRPKAVVLEGVTAYLSYLTLEVEGLRTSMGCVI